DVGNQNVFHAAAGCETRRPVAFAHGDVNRIARHVHHGNVVNGDVFQNAAVHFLEGQPFAVAKRAIGDGAIAEAAAGFRAEFDAPISAATRLHGAVEERAFLKTGDLAVHDGQVFRDDGPAERVSALGAKTVVAGRIDPAVGNHRVAAAVNVQ